MNNDLKDIKIIDTWVNLELGGRKTSKKLSKWIRDKDSQERSTLSYLFDESQQGEKIAYSPEPMLEQMDEAGIDIAVLSVAQEDPDPILKVINKYPDRFIGAVRLDPHEGMDCIRILESLVKDHGIKAAKISAHTIQKPYNDKVYYPVYAKCIELDIPITANVGIPGPRVPGVAQHPIAFDEVCWFFPELKVVMAHGGEPWQFTCVKLMLKWPNLYYMTSAFAPKYYPKEIIEYMNTRGADKVMFASDYPLLTFDRCVKEANLLSLKEHVWAKFFRENAAKVFKL
ncbi:amidohydrolase family protein [Thermodesulfobacteriota bacterium]